jgi:hypothetical protein
LPPSSGPKRKQINQEESRRKKGEPHVEQFQMESSKEIERDSIKARKANTTYLL